jgi:hypothetical protein
MSIRIDKDKLLSIIADYLSKTITPAPGPTPAGAPLIFDYFIEVTYDPTNNVYVVSIIDLVQGKISQYTASTSDDISQIINSFIASVSGKRIHIKDYSGAVFNISLSTDNLYVIENVFGVSVNSQCSVFTYNVDVVTIDSPARVVKVVNSSNVSINNVEKIDHLLIDALNVLIFGSYIENAGIRSGYLSIINSTFGEAYVYSDYIYIDNLSIKRDSAIYSNTIVGITSITSEHGIGSINGKIYGTITVPAGSSSQIKVLDTNLIFINVNVIYSVREAGLIGKVSVSYDDVNKVVTFTNSDTTSQATIDYIIVISS